MKTCAPHYWVWRRSDGYVSGTAYKPHVGGTDADGSPTTFEILLDTDDWYGEAVPRIEAERLVTA